MPTFPGPRRAFLSFRSAVPRRSSTASAFSPAYAQKGTSSREPRRRRRGDRQHLRLSRQRQARVACGDRRGDERERPRHRHRLHGRRARDDPRSLPQRRRHHRAAGLRERDGGGARRRARPARPVRRSHPRTGREADAAPLRLSEDFGRLQQPLHVLHHPETARRPRQPPGRRRVARGGKAGQGGRQGVARHLPGHQRLWRRHKIRAKPLARARSRGPISRSFARTRLARARGSACTTSIPIRMSTRSSN